jgi:hypothetical protein
MILVTRHRTHPTTIAYIKRRIQDGKSHREANRCLKRYLAREPLPTPRTHNAPLTFIEASLAQATVLVRATEPRSGRRRCASRSDNQPFPQAQIPAAPPTACAHEPTELAKGRLPGSVPGRNRWSACRSVAARDIRPRRRGPVDCSSRRSRWVSADERSPGRARTDPLHGLLRPEGRADLNHAQRSALLHERCGPAAEVPAVLDVALAVHAPRRVDHVVPAKRLLHLCRGHAELHLPNPDAGEDRRLGGERHSDAGHHDGSGRESGANERPPDSSLVHQLHPLRLPLRHGRSAVRQSLAQRAFQLGANSGSCIHGRRT